MLGILWHDTGANNPNLKRYVQPSDNAPDREQMLELLGENQYGNDYNHASTQVGMNCWIGKLADGSVTTIQTMPWDYRPWGCGSGSKGSCNSGWIQFEICEDGKTDADYFQKVYQEACEITAYLCKMFSIDPHGAVKLNSITVPTILCHQDSAKLGLGSDHNDIYDWFPKFGKNMETARDDVAALLAVDQKIIDSTPNENAIISNDKATTEEQTVAPVDKEPTTVTIRCASGYVNIRNGNGTEFTRITTARNGEMFPYVATAANGWHALLAKGQVCWVSGNYSIVS